MNDEYTEVTIKTCCLCGKELSPAEFLYHEKCIECEYCHNPVHKDIVRKLIEESGSFEPKDNSFKKIDNLPFSVYHSPCFDKKLRDDFNAREVTITQAHLDMLNRAMFAFNPNKELNFDANQTLCENNYRQWFSEMDLDNKFLVVKNLEAIAAMMQVLIGKDKKYVTDMHEKRAIEKFKERDNAIGELEDRKKRQSEANQRSYERLDKDARARKNSIEGFMKLLGISEAEAAKMVDEAKSTKK